MPGYIGLTDLALIPGLAGLTRLTLIDEFTDLTGLSLMPRFTGILYPILIDGERNPPLCKKLY